MPEPLDIMSLTIQSLCSVDMPALMQIHLRTKDCTGLDSPAALKRRILEYVHVRSLDSTPVLLGNLTRRFSKTAKRLGTSAATCIQELVGEQSLSMFERGGRTLFISTVSLNDRIRMQVEAGIDDLARHAALELMLKNVPD